MIINNKRKQQHHHANIKYQIYSSSSALLSNVNMYLIDIIWPYLALYHAWNVILINAVIKLKEVQLISHNLAFSQRLSPSSPICNKQAGLIFPASLKFTAVSSAFMSDQQTDAFHLSVWSLAWIMSSVSVSHGFCSSWWLIAAVCVFVLH